jgi:hypothetical protein
MKNEIYNDGQPTVKELASFADVLLPMKWGDAP